MNFLSKRFLDLVRGGLIILLAVTAACSASPTGSQANDGTEVEHEVEEEAGHDAGEEGENEHEEGEHAEDRVPNNGAVIRILAPAEGSTYQGDEEILVEVEVENFTLDEDGSHWHVYIDGNSYGTTVGQNTQQVLRGLELEPGEHVIEVVLALGTHQDLEEGDTVTITVEG